MRTKLGWVKGQNYYKVRNFLLKNGFKKTVDYGFYDDAKTYGWQTFDDGVETVVIKCYIKKNNEGLLVCGDVYDYYSKIYDSLENRICKAINKALNETLKNIKNI